MTRILTGDDVAAVLSLDDCIAAVEQAFRAYGEGRIAPPQSLGVHAEHGTFHIKAALADVFAAKLNANFPDNRRRHGLPTIQGVLLVVDPDDGTLLGILDSAVITTLRTAAATAVAAKYLARADARTATVIGCGVQGRAQLQALKRVRNIERVFAFDADPALTLPDAERGVALDDAVAQSDVVLTCTTSRTPVLDERHLHPGLFIAGVGADNPEKHELSPALLQRSLVVPDITEQARKMGDLHHAPEVDVHGELADVLCGRVPARQSDEEVFVFDSTGTALQDVATAALALARAAERGIGVEISLTPSAGCDATTPRAGRGR